ncbi:MAG TPA: heavy-metal-associated domain-containing protein [Terriglobales bacterium]|nr:heavy-metal-associated domain-containing protein [Terriglobales bacterium]
MRQVDLRVDGMSCGACEQRIQRALAQIDGVLQSAADHRAARVRVMFDPARTSDSDLRSCVERAGYTVQP